MEAVPVDPFELAQVRFQFGGRKNKRRADIEVHSLNLQTCSQTDFDVLVQDALKSIHVALPLAIRPGSGPKRRVTFEAQRWDGTWMLFEEVDPATVLWKEDFMARRHDESHRCKFVHLENEEHMVFARKRTMKAKAVNNQGCQLQRSDGAGGNHQHRLQACDRNYS
jgi:hypothetical protein